jgi:hypothetical protein
MRIGTTKVLQIDGIPEATFEVRTSFGARRKYLESMSSVLEIEGSKGQLGAVDATLTFLGDVLVNWSGIEDDAGNPLPYRAELLQELPEWLLTALVAQIVTGDADRGNDVSGSPSPPAISSEAVE